MGRFLSLGLCQGIVVGGEPFVEGFCQLVLTGLVCFGFAEVVEFVGILAEVEELAFSGFGVFNVFPAFGTYHALKVPKIADDERMHFLLTPLQHGDQTATVDAVSRGG